MSDIESIDMFSANTQFPEAGDICERFMVQIFGSVAKIMDHIRDEIVRGEKAVIGIVLNRKGTSIEEFLGVSE